MRDECSRERVPAAEQHRTATIGPGPNGRGYSST